MADNERQNESSAQAIAPGAPQSARERMGKVKDKFKPGVKYTLLLSLIFYLAMFIVGVVKTKDCPVNDNIPLFLIATGALGLFSKSISAMREKLIPVFPVTVLESSFYTAEIVFLILGSYWTFKVYKPSFDERDFPTRYCSKTVYMFAFVYLIVLYAIILTILLGFCCFLGCIFFVAKSEQDETRDSDPEAARPIQNPPASEHRQEGPKSEPVPT